MRWYVRLSYVFQREAPFISFYLFNTENINGLTAILTALSHINDFSQTNDKYNYCWQVVI